MTKVDVPINTATILSKNLKLGFNNANKLPVQPYTPQLLYILQHSEWYAALQHGHTIVGKNWLTSDLQ